MSSPEAFFAFARQRHGINVARAKGNPWPWTTDPVLRQFKFTNVFRELDKTTLWFAQHVRGRYTRPEDILLATVVFRWFNRIATGEALFNCKGVNTGLTAFEHLLLHGDVGVLEHACQINLGSGPYVTGAYIITAPSGMKKLPGVCQNIHTFMTGQWLIRHDFDLESNMVPVGYRAMAKMLAAHDGRAHMQFFWEWLRQVPYMGHFHSYEVTCDLRYTPLLQHAPDRCTWANPGPGAERGLARVHGRVMRDDGRGTTQRVSRAEMIREMADLLLMSRDREYWPRGWPAWEMREVEHTLCEFDKYERLRLGQGKTKGVYRHA